ncbi:MAG: hypothetical protein MH204_08885, partial [Fimbriimonadaceae bacterium]|nr:hypothetical protein [Fimbriimonadaceae bacterium]
MHPILSLVLGLVFAGVGGDLFVRGAVGLASWARIPAGVIGATVAAFATSSPELSVAVNSALKRTPEIALGDALGSNVVNVAFILGAALLLGPIHCNRGSLGRDFPVALMAPIVTLLLCLDGSLSQLECGLLAAAFFAWLSFATFEAIRGRTPADGTAKGGPAAILFAIGGLALLVLAGQNIVVGAKEIGAWLGWDAFVVGAVLVAIGTSIPEMATTLSARLKGEDDVGLGTVLGSNIFNGLFTVSVAGLIHPIAVDPRQAGVGLVFVIAS